MTFIWPLDPRHPPFLCIYCYYKYTAEHVDNNMMFLWFRTERYWRVILKEKSQNDREIYLHINNKQNGYENVNFF